ncbi:MAG: ABC transporter ATP-binding protein [Micropruina sp.]|uniref:ABC transporter ATP-binding protein n=1 Tax=Micropruina sp. TaxID=2737536 RepID=UPI0039E6132A
MTADRTHRGPATTAGGGAELRAESIAVGYGEHVVIPDLSLTLLPGAVTALIGPNGCGKSTLLRALARLLGLRSGSVLLDGQDIHRLPTKQVAKRLGILPQSPRAPEAITVGDLVWRGRHPHQRLGQRRTRADEEAVLDALDATGSGDLVARRVDSLSGGQRQRVWISMALAQQTPYLLLDEPTTFLDIAHQLEVLDLLVDLNRSRGTTIVLVSHDLNQAARYADVVVAMAQGRIIGQGPPADIVTADLVARVFDIAAEVIAHPVTGRPLVLPLGRHDRAPAPDIP